jgi:transposase
LPEQAGWASQQMLAQVDTLGQPIEQFEQRLAGLVEVTVEMQRLMSLPGVGVILAATMQLEIGDIARFPSAQHLAS